MRSTGRSQKGASVVEFAIMAPLFIALLFAIVEFGMILYTKSMLAHASREGARFGVVYSVPRRTAGEIQGVVQNFLDRCDLTSTAAVTVYGAGGTSWNNLEVRINYTYHFFVLPQNINHYVFGKMADLNLTAKTVMRME